MIIAVEGPALRLLDDFICYASEYPAQLANAMWYEEDFFSFLVLHLKMALDEAKINQISRFPQFPVQ
jgi:hypothetical protein